MAFLKNARIRVEKQPYSLNQIFTGSSSGSKSVVNEVTGTVALTANQLCENLFQNKTDLNQSVETKKKERKWNPCLGCKVMAAQTSRLSVILWTHAVCGTICLSKKEKRRPSFLIILSRLTTLLQSALSLGESANTVPRILITSSSVQLQRRRVPPTLQRSLQLVNHSVARGHHQRRTCRSQSSCKPS